jgi:hypothetical protein
MKKSKRETNELNKEEERDLFHDGERAAPPESDLSEPFEKSVFI